VGESFDAHCPARAKGAAASADGAWFGRTEARSGAQEASNRLAISPEALDGRIIIRVFLQLGSRRCPRGPRPLADQRGVSLSREARSFKGNSACLDLTHAERGVVAPRTRFAAEISSPP
jgi:hypothetical protein